MSEQQTVFKTRFTTVWIIILTAAALIAWDLYARRFDGGTISEVMLTWVRAHPAIPFSLGVLGGHFCWPQLVTQGENRV